MPGHSPIPYKIGSRGIGLAGLGEFIIYASSRLLGVRLKCSMARLVTVCGPDYVALQNPKWTVSRHLGVSA